MFLNRSRKLIEAKRLIPAARWLLSKSDNLFRVIGTLRTSEFNAKVTKLFIVATSSYPMTITLLTIVFTSWVSHGITLGVWLAPPSTRGRLEFQAEIKPPCVAKRRSFETAINLSIGTTLADVTWCELGNQFFTDSSWAESEATIIRSALNLASSCLPDRAATCVGQARLILSLPSPITVPFRGSLLGS